MGSSIELPPEREIDMANKFVINPIEFENAICERSDVLDNAVLEMCKTITGREDLEWDEFIYGEIKEFIVDTLNKHGIDTCYPYYLDDDTYCVNGDECTCKNCIFKK